MQDIKVIRNYVDALFDNAKQKHKEEEVFQHLKKVVELINTNSELKNILYSPIIPKTNKSRLIDKLTSFFGTDEGLIEFLHVLIKNSRENVLDYILTYYKQRLDASKNIKQVKVKSFKVLDDKDKELLIKYLKTYLIKHDIEVKYEEDSSLLGGILIQYDNNIMDFSIAGALKKIDDVTRSTIVK